MRKGTQTDWTSYYSKSKSIWSSITQKATLKIIIDVMNQHVFTGNHSKKISLVELGGGNSCFAEAVCNEAMIQRYDVIDNNELSISLFKQKKLNAKEYEGILENVLEGNVPARQYDFVYSVGLIEHFTKQQRDIVIKSHFNHCKEGGMVMISFPTPTLKYRMVRKFMEVLKVWNFWDEVPLVFEDVKDAFEENGIIKSVQINKALPLTQMVVVVEKNGE